MQEFENDEFDTNEVFLRSGFGLAQADRTGVVVVAVSLNDIDIAGVSAGASLGVAVQVVGVVLVHDFTTLAHIDDGAQINQVAGPSGLAANAAQSVSVAAARGYRLLAIGSSVSISGLSSTAPAASVPVLTGNTKAWIGADGGPDSATDAHTGDATDDFATDVSAAGDVSVTAVARSSQISVNLGVAGSGGAAVGGSAAIVVISTTTRASISGDVSVLAGGTVSIIAFDDTKIVSVAGAVGIGAGVGGAGAFVITVITKKTEAVIGGGAYVDGAGAAGTSVPLVPTGEMTVAGDGAVTIPTLSRRGVVVWADSSEDILAVAASGAGGFVGLGGAVAVEVLNSDTTATITGDAHVNTRNATTAAGTQSVAVVAVNQVDVLVVAGAVAVGVAGAGLSVDVGVMRNDTTALISGATVAAKDTVLVVALAPRRITSSAFALAAGGLGISGGVVVWIAGGDFVSTYTVTEEDENGDDVTSSEDPLEGGGTDVLSEADTMVGDLLGLLESDDDSALEFDPSTGVNTATDEIDLGIATGEVHGLRTGDRVTYSAGGGTAIGGLTDGETYYVIAPTEYDSTDDSVSEAGTIQLAETFADAMSGTAIDLTSTGSGSTHSLENQAATEANAARAESADEDTEDALTDVTGSPTSVTSGTSAVIDGGSTIIANSVVVVARDSHTLFALAGGVGVGAAAGIGIGVVVIDSTADISAVIASGVTVRSRGSDGSLSVVAEHDSNLDSYGVAGAAGLFAGLGAAVSVVHEGADTRALLGAQVVGGAVTTGTGATVNGEAADDSFGDVLVSSDSNVVLGIATGAAGIGAAGLGAAITVATVDGVADAVVGDGTTIGTATDKVASVAVLAKSVIDVVPARDAVSEGDPMGIAIGGGGIAIAAGVTEVTIAPGGVLHGARALIGDDAQIYTTGDVQVSAEGKWTTEVDTDGAAVGAVAIGVVISRADVRGTVLAHIGDDVVIDANSVAVTATGEAIGFAESLAAGGGILSGRGSVADAEVHATATADIGSATIITIGDVTVTAEYLFEADAVAKGYGGGLIDAGVSIADSSVTGNAEASIDTGASVTASALTVTAQQKALGPQPPDNVISVDAVNNTITYGDFGLGTGDAVQYQAGGATIDSLGDGRRYYVLSGTDGAPGQLVLTLGVAFDGKAQVRTNNGITIEYGVDEAFDVIRFPGPHQLRTGDPVVYRAPASGGLGIRLADGTVTTLTDGTTYYVHVLDAQTIKLFTSQDAARNPGLATFDPSDDVVDAANSITVAGTSWAVGQAVTYRTAKRADFAAPLVDLELESDNRTIVTTDGTIDYNNSNVIYFDESAKHGLTDGEAVQYHTDGSAITNLTDGGIYYVILINDQVIQLATRYCEAVGCSDDPLTPGGTPDPVSITAIDIGSVATDTTTRHWLSDPIVTGLVDGRTYYVLTATGSTYTLADSASATTPVGIGYLPTTDATTDQFLGPEGLDLIETTGQHRLVIDILPGSSNVTSAKLLGPGGVPLAQVSPPTGDGVSSTSATASNGGLVAIADNEVSVYINQTVTAASAADLTITGDVTITADNQTASTASLSNSNGGVIAVKDSNADIEVIVTTNASIGGVGTVGGDIWVEATGDHDLDASSDASGGGFVDVAGAHTTIDVTPNSSANVDDDAEIRAVGDVTVQAGFDATVKGSADAQSGGFIADANGDSTVKLLTSSTTVEVGDDALIAGETVALLATPGRVRIVAETETDAGGLGVGNRNDTLARATHTAGVTVAALAEVIGNRGVDIRAVYGDFQVNATGDGDTDALFAYTRVDVEADARNVKASVVGVDEARVTASPRISGTPLRTPSDFTALALFVVANTNNVEATKSRSRDCGVFDACEGGNDEYDPGTGDDTITWDSDVVVLAGVAPYLVVAADGTIETMVGLTATVVGSNVVVADITNSGGGGAAFRSGQIAGTGTYKALFEMRETFGSVTIFNHSVLNLVIGNIDLRTTVDPYVDLDADGSGQQNLTFRIARTVGPTIITITNDAVIGSADITLNGTIENPLGMTTIHAQVGNIVSGTSRDETVSGRISLIRTRDLVITAPNGSVGTSTTRINIDLVQSALFWFREPHGLRTGDVVTYTTTGTALTGLTADDPYVVVRVDDYRFRLAADATTAAAGTVLTVDPGNLVTGQHTLTGPTGALSVTDGTWLEIVTGNDIFTDIKGRLRDPAAAGRPHVFTIELLQSGTDGQGYTDSLLQAAVAELAAGNAGGVLVTANTGGRGPYTARPFYLLFDGDPAGTAAGAALDVGYFGGSPSDIDATYHLEYPLAGGGISAGLIAEGIGDITLLHTPASATSARVNILGLTEIIGTGHIDVDTNGFVTLTEQSDDLRAGRIASSLDDVTLTAPGSIVDAPTGADLAATTGDAAPDVIGVDITLTAGTADSTAGIGSNTNFLEIDSSVGGAFGVLWAQAPQVIRITETSGDLNVDTVRSVNSHVTLATLSGSILDGRNGGAGDDAANVFGDTIDLDANGGDIGALTGTVDNDLEIDSGRITPSVADVSLEATGSIYLTETDSHLRLVQAVAENGDIRLTVRETTPDASPDAFSLDENLYLLPLGDARFTESGSDAPRQVPRGIISAVASSGTVLLRVGDNVDTHENSQILAGDTIDIYGDWNNADADYGTTIVLRGDVVSGYLATGTNSPPSETRVFGDTDVDTFQLGDPIPTSDPTLHSFGTTPGNYGYIRLGAITRVYGSGTDPRGTTATPADDGEDRFYVYYLQTMNVAAGHTLTLDGQADTDTYEVWTTGSQGDVRDYVINVLDTGAPDDGVDTLDIFGADSTLNGLIPGTTDAYDVDDIFLLRATKCIDTQSPFGVSDPDSTDTSPATACDSPVEVADRPAFVALLHGDVADYRYDGAGDTNPGQIADVQRINYDTALNGRLSVFGRGGNDAFFVDDTSAITTLDGGAGSDSFQIGQIFGTKRDVAEGAVAPHDTFPVLIATTRGWLSPGISAPLVATGGTGDDQFTVYSNQAELRLEGDDDNDLFVIRAFALAAVCDTDADGDGDCDLADVTLDPDLVSGRYPVVDGQVDIGGGVLVDSCGSGASLRLDNNRDGICNNADAHITTGVGDWEDDVIPLDGDGVAVPVIGLGFSTARPLDIRTGGGEDEVQYNVNAPVSVDGGTGFDKLVVLGTEFADDIVITATGIVGAGLNVRYANLEIVEVDGLEGDDEFFVRSTAFGVAYRVIGGLGSDTINVAGDVVEDIVTQELEGASGAIDHLLSSDGDLAYDGLPADGIETNVATAELGAIIVEESGSGTTVRENGSTVTFGGSSPTADTYTVRISDDAAAGLAGTVYVTVSAAALAAGGGRRPARQPDRRSTDGKGDTVWLCTPDASGRVASTATHAQPLPAPHRRRRRRWSTWRNRALVLAFDARRLHHPADGLPAGDRRPALGG